MKVYGAKTARATFILAHGAGAESKSDWIVSHAKALAKRGVRVVTFDFPKVRRAMLPLEAAYLAIVAKTHERFPNEPLSIGGKSMGGRVASMVCDDLFAKGRVAGLLCLGYPFHPVGKPEHLRTAHLENLKTPALIVQGTRDPFGTRDEVASYKLSKQIEILWLEDGDHDLKPRKAISGFSAANHLATLAKAASSWVEKVVRKTA